MQARPDPAGATGQRRTPATGANEPLRLHETHRRDAGAPFRQAMRTALPAMDEQLAGRHFEPVLGRLRKKVHEKGKCLTPQEFLVEATGLQTGTKGRVGSYTTRPHAPL